MDKIGEYEYPNLGTFNEALSLAKEALDKHGGIMPSIDAAHKLGYNVKNAAAIGGQIYKRINDLCVFGLFTRERGCLKTTPLAVEALHPYDSTTATEGKAKAIRRIKLVERAFDAWNAEIPDEIAFPAKLVDITGVSWQEAQKHAKAVRTLIIEAFQYLKPSALAPVTVTPPASRQEGSVISTTITQQTAETAAALQPYGELRTTMGSIVIKDQDTLGLAKQLLELLGKQLREKKEN
jgi:hypothetical protein